MTGDTDMTTKKAGNRRGIPGRVVINVTKMNHAEMTGSVPLTAIAGIKMSSGVKPTTSNVKPTTSNVKLTNGNARQSRSSKPENSAAQPLSGRSMQLRQECMVAGIARTAAEIQVGIFNSSPGCR